MAINYGSIHVRGLKQNHFALSSAYYTAHPRRVPHEYAVLTARRPCLRLLRLPRQLLNLPTENAKFLSNPLRPRKPVRVAHHPPAPSPPPDPKHLLNPSPHRSPTVPLFLPLSLGCEYVSGFVISLSEGLAGVFGDFSEYFESDLFGLCRGRKEGRKATEGFVEKGCVGEGGGCQGGEVEYQNEGTRMDNCLKLEEKEDSWYFCILDIWTFWEKLRHFGLSFLGGYFIIGRRWTF